MLIDSMIGLLEVLASIALVQSFAELNFFLFLCNLKTKKLLDFSLQARWNIHSRIFCREENDSSEYFQTQTVSLLLQTVSTDHLVCLQVLLQDLPLGLVQVLLAGLAPLQQEALGLGHAEEEPAPQLAHAGVEHGHVGEDVAGVGYDEARPLPVHGGHALLQQPQLEVDDRVAERTRPQDGGHQQDRAGDVRH